MDYEAFTHKLMQDIRANGGEVKDGPFAGRPLMILHTTGAKTGSDRSAVITYTRDGDRYVIAASKGGAPQHPAWFHNLSTHPEVTVEAGGQQFRARAAVASGDDRNQLWDRHAEARPEFREYPKKTDRVIPMIRLERIA